MQLLRLLLWEKGIGSLESLNLDPAGDFGCSMMHFLEAAGSPQCLWNGICPLALQCFLKKAVAVLPEGLQLTFFTSVRNTFLKI